MSEYSHNYRDICFEEYAEGCFFCGTSDSVEVHHVDGDVENDAVDNLLPVCHDHHIAIHCGRDGFEEWSDELDEIWPTEAQIGQPTVSKQVTIPEHQAEWIRENHLRLSSFIQEELDKYITAQVQ